jgi:hypothetical protein
MPWLTESRACPFVAVANGQAHFIFDDSNVKPKMLNLLYN